MMARFRPILVNDFLKLRYKIFLALVMNEFKSACDCRTLELITCVLFQNTLSNPTLTVYIFATENTWRNERKTHTLVHQSTHLLNAVWAAPFLNGSTGTCHHVTGFRVDVTSETFILIRAFKKEVCEF